MAEEKTALSPRETAMRMLLHVDDSVSYEDIIRQLRILQQIDRTMGSDGEASWLEEVIPEALPESSALRSEAGSPNESSPDRLKGAVMPRSWADDAFEMRFGASKFAVPFQMESADYAPYPSSGLPSLVLRSRPLYSWRTLAERSDDRSDSFLNSATWIY